MKAPFSQIQVVPAKPFGSRPGIANESPWLENADLRARARARRMTGIAVPSLDLLLPWAGRRADKPKLG